MIDLAPDVLILVVAAGGLGCVLGYLARRVFSPYIPDEN